MPGLDPGIQAAARTPAVARKRYLHPNSLGFTLLIGALAGLPPLSIDMGLPALPLLQASLGANSTQGAMTISLFFAGFGLAQLVLGPLSDRIGRRPVLLAGLSLYTAAGAGCALSPAILPLLICRFVQGVGAAGGTVLAFAIIRDVYDGAAARTRLSTISMVFSLAPVIAPTLGGLLLLVGRWRANYAVLTGAGLLLTLCAATALAETRQPRPLSHGIYRPVLRQPRTIGYAFVAAFNGGSVLAFVTGSPLVLLDSLHLTSLQFGFVFASISIGIVIGAFVNARLARYGVGAIWPLAFGLGATPLAAFTLCALAALGRLHVAVMIPLLLTVTFSRGMINPNAVHAALEPVAESAGAASAVIGSLQMLMGSLAGLAVGALYPALGAGAMGVTMAGFSLLSLGAWLLIERTRKMATDLVMPFVAGLLAVALLAVALRHASLLQRLRLIGEQTLAAQRSEAETLRSSLASTERALTASMGSAGGQLRLEVSGAIAEMRTALDGRLRELREGNEAKLAEIQKTVNEQLHAAVEKQMTVSFARVTEQFAAVQKAMGDVQAVTAQIGDIKRLFGNVKTRGGWGEAQVRAMLDDVLPAGGYETNWKPRADSNEAVEFAVIMPMRGESKPRLPIDAKFPVEDYERLLAAADAGDVEGERVARRALEKRVRDEAKKLASKYIAPPATVEFAVMYLPTDGLYAEVARCPGLIDEIGRVQRVLVLGPALFPALLHTISLGYLTLRLEQKTDEIGRLLGATRTEMQKIDEVLARLGKQAKTFSNTIETAQRRTRAVGRVLRGVPAVPAEDAERLLEMGDAFDEEETEGEAA